VDFKLVLSLLAISLCINFDYVILAHYNLNAKNSVEGKPTKNDFFNCSLVEDYM